MGEFSYNATYPPVKVKKQNRKTAQMLTQDLAAKKSEMTTIQQYTYQQLVLRAKHPEIAKIIGGIAVVEQRHYDMVGRLILLLGGNPKCRAFEQNEIVMWNGQMVYYATDVKEILAANIKMEQGAYEAYASQAKSVDDPYVSAVLARLSLDEKLHMELFQTLQKKYLHTNKV